MIDADLRQFFQSFNFNAFSCINVSVEVLIVKHYYGSKLSLIQSWLIKVEISLI